jgi:hypothetical protein
MTVETRRDTQETKERVPQYKAYIVIPETNTILRLTEFETSGNLAIVKPNGNEDGEDKASVRISRSQVIFLDKLIKAAKSRTKPVINQNPDTEVDTEIDGMLQKEDSIVYADNGVALGVQSKPGIPSAIRGMLNKFQDNLGKLVIYRVNIKNPGRISFAGYCLPAGAKIVESEEGLREILSAS